MADWFMDKGIRIICIIVVAVILFFILRFLIPPMVKRLISGKMTHEDPKELGKRTKTLSSILVTITGIVIAILAILTILPEVGVNIATLIAGLGIGGLAIAFAAQNLVRDFITGFFILLEDQYRVGDVVSVAGHTGEVEEIGLRRTVLRDLDGNVHSVPNGKVEVSTNMTKKFSRVNFDVSVGYGANLEQVKDIINSVCLEIAEDPKWKPDIITTPAVVRINRLGEAGVDIGIMGDVKPCRQWDVMGEIRLRLKNTFEKLGIERPRPGTSVFFGNTPPVINKN